MNPLQLCLAISLMGSVLGCAGPVSGLWPPPAEVPAHEIIVSLDTWHAMIGFPRTEVQGLRTERQESGVLHQSSALSPHAVLYEEWGFAEQAWYLEGRQGFTGALRALLWSTDAVVEVARYDQPWSARTPDPPADEFAFHLSEEGYHKLREFLEVSKASNQPLLTTRESTFYAAREAYTVFHQCHHYVAQALREAGLPVSSFWALTREMFASELRRVQRILDEFARDNHSLAEDGFNVVQRTGRT